MEGKGREWDNRRAGERTAREGGGKVSNGIKLKHVGNQQ